MSDPVQSAEIEDVLSSIRRLVAGETARRDPPDGEADAAGEHAVPGAQASDAHLLPDASEGRAAAPHSYPDEDAKTLESSDAPNDVVSTDVEDVAQPRPLVLQPEQRVEPEGLALGTGATDTRDEPMSEASPDHAPMLPAHPEEDADGLHHASDLPGSPAASLPLSAVDPEARDARLGNLHDLWAKDARSDGPISNDGEPQPMAEPDETPGTGRDPLTAAEEVPSLDSGAVPDTPGDMSPLPGAADTPVREQVQDRDPEPAETKPRRAGFAFGARLSAARPVSMPGPTQPVDHKTDSHADGSLEDDDERILAATSVDAPIPTAAPQHPVPEAGAIDDDSVDDPDDGLANDSAQPDMSDNLFDADDEVPDDEALRRLVHDIVMEELQGALGERITRNVRKLVRREIQQALAARDL